MFPGVLSQLAQLPSPSTAQSAFVRVGICSCTAQRQGGLGKASFRMGRGLVVRGALSGPYTGHRQSQVVASPDIQPSLPSSPVPEAVLQCPGGQ